MALRRALLALPLLAATAATTAAAQAPASPPAADVPAGIRVGLGFGLGPSGVLPAIYVPVDAGGARTELELGYEGSPSDDEADSVLRAGLGLFGLVPAEGAVRGYSGVRFRYVRAESAGAATEAALRAALVVGGEWVPHPSVAVGAEAQLGHSWVSDPDGAPNRIDATAQAFLRVFTAFGGRAAPPAAAAPAPAEPSAQPPPSAPAASPRRAPPSPKRLVPCRSNDECDVLEICYEGHCRR